MKIQFNIERLNLLQLSIIAGMKHGLDIRGWNAGHPFQVIEEYDDVHDAIARYVELLPLVQTSCK